MSFRASVVAFLLVIGSVSAAQAQTNGTLYVPVAPCRIANWSTTGPVWAGGVLSFLARGTNLVSRQGADPSCNTSPVPSNATAVMLNITASADGNGDLRAWAWNQPLPSASILNYV